MGRPTNRMRTARTSLVTALALAGGLGCAQAFTTVPDITAADTACESGQAQIAVGDGWQQILCGCQEAGGQVISADAGTALTCTVPNGTVMFIHYQATTLNHQIVSTGATAFPSSEMSDPLSSTKIGVHAFTLTAAGTYAYQDAFNPAINGQFVVTP